jgi:hypothetical protein
MKNQFNIGDTIFYFEHDKFQKNKVREVVFRQDGVRYNLSSPYITLSENDVFSTPKKAYEATLKSNKKAFEEDLEKEQTKIKKYYSEFIHLNKNKGGEN